MMGMEISHRTFALRRVGQQVEEVSYRRAPSKAKPSSLASMTTADWIEELARRIKWDAEFGSPRRACDPPCHHYY